MQNAFEAPRIRAGFSPADAQLLIDREMNIRPHNMSVLRCRTGHTRLAETDADDMMRRALSNSSLHQALKIEDVQSLFSDGEHCFCKFFAHLL